MDINCIILGAKVVKGVAEILIDTLQDFEDAKHKKKRNKKVIRYPLSKNVSEQDLLMHVGKGLIKISINGGLIDNIWPAE